MAAQKFLSKGQTPGTFDEKIPVVASTGTPDGGRLPAVGDNGRLEQSLLPFIYEIEASEALVAGDFVNIHYEGGKRLVRKASAVDTTRPAHGFVRAASNAAAIAFVYVKGINDAVANAGLLTPETVLGREVCLSATAPGAMETVCPAAPGQIIQPMGRIVDVTPTVISVDFDPKTIVLLA